MTAPPSDLDPHFSALVIDPSAARADLARRWQRATEEGDAEAAFDAVAGVLLAINTEFVDFRQAATWCARFAEGWTAEHADAACVQAAAGDGRALRRCAAALVWPSLDHAGPSAQRSFQPEAQALAAGLRSRLDIAPDERLALTKSLLDYHGQQMDTLAAARLLALEHERMGLAPPAPLVQARWWFTVMAHHGYFGEAAQAAHARERLQALIDAQGFAEVRFALLTVDMPELLKTGQLQRADKVHREIDALLPQMGAGLQPQGLRAQAMYLAQRGDHAAALACIDQLLAICSDVEVPERDQGAYRVQRANVLVALQRHDEAVAELERLRPSQTGTQGELLEVLRAFALAARAVDTAHGDPAPVLAEAFGGAARLHFNRFFLTFPPLAARLCQAALDRGIETEFVRATVRQRSLPAPDRSREDWPWRLRVRVLGALAVERDDQPLRWTGKTPRKPLELLALLAAHGGGPIGTEAVMDALWPSLEAQAPKASLEMAVSRLRKLLELPEAVLVVDGGVSLDPQLVWCDAMAFDLLSERAAAVPDVELATQAVQRAFALYRDQLLGTEAMEGRMLLARERLALRFQQLVRTWGAQLEAEGRWELAVTLYERALARDVLAEPNYRALMRVHLARGERGEVIRWYRRCRDLLGSVLGIAPGSETQALFEAARADP